MRNRQQGNKAARHITTLLLCLASLVSFGQTTITGDRVVAKQHFFLRDRWVSGIKTTDTVFQNKYDSLVTAGAVADYVTRRLAGIGGATPTFQQVLDAGYTATGVIDFTGTIVNHGEIDLLGSGTTNYTYLMPGNIEQGGDLATGTGSLVQLYRGGGLSNAAVYFGTRSYSGARWGLGVIPITGISNNFRLVRGLGDANDLIFSVDSANGLTTFYKQIRYAGNYGSLFNSRTLVDKGYVDSLHATGGGGGSTDTSSLSNRIDAKPKVYNVKDFGAKGDEKYLYDVVMTSGSATLTSAAASFVIGDTGKVILVRGAGTSGADLITTIAGRTNATTITLAANAATTVSAEYAKYATDDTEAQQAAYNAAMDAGGGEIYYPAGGYGTAGALVTSDNNGNNPNSQLYIKAVALTNSRRHHIVIRGEYPPNFVTSGIASDILRPTTGTWISSYRSNTSGVNPSVISTVGLAGAPNPGENYAYLTVKDLGVAVPSNPGGSGINISGINGLNFASVIYENVNVTSETSAHLAVEPTADCFGLATSKVGTEISSMATNCEVWNTKYGIVYGEHATLINNTVACTVGGYVPLRSNTPVWGYGNKALWNRYHIFAPSSTLFGITEGRVDMKFDLETENISNTRWWSTIATIKDDDNYLHGQLHHSITQSGTGWADSLSDFVKDDGVNLLCAPIRTGIFRWTTTGRPIDVLPGTQGYNLDSNFVEYHNGSTWVAMGPSISGGGGSYETEVQSFITRHTAAGGSMTTAEKNRLNTLIAGIKADGDYAELAEMYIPIGGTAGTNALAFKDASHNLTFSGGWTHSAYKSTPNGTSGYANTHYTLAGNSTTGAIGLGIVTTDNVNTSLDQIDIGASNSSNQIFISTQYNASGFSNRFLSRNASTSAGLIDAANADATGFYFTNDVSGTVTAYKNGTSAGTASSAGAGPNAEIYIGALDDSGTATLFSNRGFAIAIITDQAEAGAAARLKARFKTYLDDAGITVIP
jgi:hypothetical protein